MKLIYICSPYRAEDKKTLKRNIEYAKEITRWVLMRGDAAVTPHLYMTKCLNDDIPEEREIGLKAGKEIILRCDAVFVGEKYGISKGMKEEIEFAKAMRIPVIEIDVKQKG